uniref:ORF265 n=1 Tax=Brassica napus TaxID=3708 RepID=F8K8R0_BRANA|nr:hypothetical protein [Brassica napus]AIZ06245.1 hypothetical protein [Brassica napus]UUC04616.1 hypothetical protein [Brassica napus]UUC04670.1 hypothetical protein [Brassica napus]UUC04937.1 hypothetical protein [Brassica napus]
MILSVLSSPALVFGLLVTRAINFVHSVLFPIPVFCSIETFFTYFSSFPIIRKLSMKWQFLWFSIFRFIFSIIMIKLFFSVGYLCFDDLTRAISQFYPPISGFMGGGNTPMPPTNPFDGFLSSYFDNERSNDQRRGSPSWSEQLPAESGLYLNLDVESSDSLRARNLQLGEDLERIHEMERNLQNERDPDRRREGAERIDREVRELERKISLCQTRDAVRDDQLDVWREGLYEELATQGEKQARLTLLNSWLKVIIHTRNHQPPKN